MLTHGRDGCRTKSRSLPSLSCQQLHLSNQVHKLTFVILIQHIGLSRPQRMTPLMQLLKHQERRLSTALSLMGSLAKTSLLTMQSTLPNTSMTTTVFVLCLEVSKRCVVNGALTHSSMQARQSLFVKPRPPTRLLKSTFRLANTAAQSEPSDRGPRPSSCLPQRSIINKLSSTTLELYFFIFETPNFTRFTL